MRCEDYPCCGHESGDCPDEKGRMLCVGCSKRVSPKRPNSWCSDSCMRRDLKRQEEREFYG